MHTHKNFFYQVIHSIFIIILHLHIPFNYLIIKILCSRIIWLGDLNYRIALSYRSAKALVEMQNWRALLENDQAWSKSSPHPLLCFLSLCLKSLFFFFIYWGLSIWNFDVLLWQLRIEQRRGRVFEGWNEGKIYFPPTYKYSNNSDRYSGDDMHPKEKRRTPAWYVHLSYLKV